ncbi:MAG: hypothetical protein IPN25_17100 [Sphingobacteriales bacterium]|nr:hypothetical protein [Sphingobacteriales bacterium]
MWLLQQLAPDHNTIANFRKDNQKPSGKYFGTPCIAKQFQLIGGKLSLPGDSTKLRAQNSKKNNFNEKKIAQHLAYIDKKLDEYNAELAAADEDNKQTIQAEIDKQTQRKQNYQVLQQQLEDTGEKQISTTDPDSRQLITRKQYYRSRVQRANHRR